MALQAKQRHSMKELVIFLSNLRIQGASYQTAHLHGAEQFPISCSRFHRTRAQSNEKSIRKSLTAAATCAQRDSPTSLIAPHLVLHRGTQALIAITANYNLPICLLAPCPTAFTQALLFLHCLVPELYPHLCPWPWGGTWSDEEGGGRFSFPLPINTFALGLICSVGKAWQGDARSLVMFADEKFSSWNQSLCLLLLDFDFSKTITWMNLSGFLVRQSTLERGFQWPKHFFSPLKQSPRNRGFSLVRILQCSLNWTFNLKNVGPNIQRLLARRKSGVTHKWWTTPVGTEVSLACGAMNCWVHTGRGATGVWHFPQEQ